MNKFTKLTGASLLSVGLIELIRNFKNLKLSLNKDRQLTNRLLEQVKDFRTSLAHLNKSLGNINLSKVSNQLKNFNHDLKPRLNQIQLNLNKIKKNH